MPTALQRRFRDWLGLWRGAITWAGGDRGILEFAIEPIFNGQAIQLRAVAFDNEGASVSMSLSFLSPDGRGHIVQNIFHSAFGFAVLHELPEEPDSLVVQGQLPGNRYLSAVMHHTGSELRVSARLGEGYLGQGSDMRDYSCLRRVGSVDRSTAEDE